MDKQILDLKFEEGSVSGIKEETTDAGRQMISAKDIELPDTDVCHREHVCKMLIEFEDMQQGQLCDVKGRAHKI